MAMAVARMRERRAGEELRRDHKDRGPDHYCQSAPREHEAAHIKKYGGNWRI
jgi:hypothetical protein